MPVRSMLSRRPFMAGVVAIILIWCLWSFEIPQKATESVTAKAIQQICTQTEDEGARLALDTIMNKHPQALVAASKLAAASDPTKVTTKYQSLRGSDRPLILYAYSESKNAQFNLEFFINHGLHAQADFIFIFNGPTDVTSKIPAQPNIRYVQRANDCYDLGAYAEVLTQDGLFKKYKNFIMLNASIRGPFLPYWSEGCWTDMYLSKITDEVKVELVGMTANCWPSMHVQSMIWATDIVGIETLLNPPKAIVQQLMENPTYPPQTETAGGVKLSPHFSGINSCFHTWGDAVAAEIGSSALIKAAGYKLDVMMAAYHAADDYESICDKSRDGGDVLWDGAYFGINVHPFETVFMKSNRDVDPVTIDHLTQWTMGRGYNSYEFCKA